MPIFRLRDAAFFLLLAALTLAARAEKLRSPWDKVQVAINDSAYACPAAPAFAKTLTVDSYYIDKHASVVDQKKYEAFQAASEAPTHLGQFAARAADAFLEKGSRAAALCLYSLLDAAAQAEAWTGKMPGFQGVYMQNWTLSGVAMAYLKVRPSGVGTPDQEAHIRRWFRLLGGRVREYFDAEMKRLTPENENNHLYWAGLALSAEGIAANDSFGFQWGLAACRQGLRNIQPDGSLTAEMNRGQKAWHYHLYALGPLVMVAELGAANGMDLYAEERGALHRLADFCIGILQNPSLIEARAGAAQEVANPLGGLEVGWAVPYSHRFPDPRLAKLLAQAAWTGFWQWGGAPPQ
jgi:poly(beta-D-mannuronate) lyase